MEDGFLMDVDATMLFFRACRRYHIDGYDARRALLGAIARRGKAKYLRDVGEFTRGKATLRVTNKRSPDNAN